MDSVNDYPWHPCCNRNSTRWSKVGSVGYFEGCAVAVAAVVAVVAVVAVAVAVELVPGLSEALDDLVDEGSVGASVDRFGDCAVAGSTGSWRGAEGADAAVLPVAAVSLLPGNLDVYLEETFSLLIGEL